MSRKRYTTKKQDYISDNIIISSELLRDELFQIMKKEYYTYNKAINVIKIYCIKEKISIKSIDEYKQIYNKISYRLPESPDQYYEKDDFNWANYLGLKKPTDNQMIYYINDLLYK